MTPTDGPWDEDRPVSSIPLNIEGARDLDEKTAARLSEQINRARNPEELKQIADKIVEATHYGVSHVLSTSGFGHAFALSGLPRAAALAQRIEDKGNQKHGWPSVDDQEYRGYREALYDQDEG